MRHVHVLLQRPGDDLVVKRNVRHRVVAQLQAFGQQTVAHRQVGFGLDAVISTVTFPASI